MFENLKKEHEEKVDDIFADTDQPNNQSESRGASSPENLKFNPEQPLMDRPLSEKKTNSNMLSDFDEDHSSKSNKVLKTMFIIIIVLAIIGLAAYFVYSKILAPQALDTNTNIEKQNMEELFKDSKNTIEDDLVVDVASTTEEIASTTEENAGEEAIDPFASLRALDSDVDGLNDYEETYVYMTDLTSADTDGDGLSDFDELMIFGTDPLNIDTDGDTYSDGQEVTGGYNPLGSGEIDSSIFVDQDLFNEKYSDL
jgi:hypothetical protein